MSSGPAEQSAENTYWLEATLTANGHKEALGKEIKGRRNSAESWMVMGVSLQEKPTSEDARRPTFSLVQSPYPGKQS